MDGHRLLGWFPMVHNVSESSLVAGKIARMYLTYPATMIRMV